MKQEVTLKQVTYPFHFKKKKLNMKKTLLWALFVFFTSCLLYSQDIIKKTNGEQINCKIQKVDSIFIFFQFKKNEAMFNTYINKSEVSSIQYSVDDLKKNREYFNDRNVVLKIDLFAPAIGIEMKLDDDKTILFSYQPGFVYTQVGNDPSKIYVVNQFRGSFRCFYNINNRIERGKRTDKFAGDFFSFSIKKGVPSPINESFLIFNPGWGIQRNWGGVIHFSFEIGPAYIITNEKTAITYITDLKLGFAL